MMKKFLHFILFLTLAFNMTAQDFTLEPGEFYWEFGTDSEVKKIGYLLTNTTEDTKEWTWTIEKGEDFPEDWTIEVCDQISCWAPNTFAMPNDGLGANILTAGAATVPFNNYIRVTNNGVEGTGSLKFCVFENFDFSDEVLCSDFSTSTGDLNINTISIYPNPTLDYFHISANSQISKIDVYNIVGKRVKSFNHNANATYDVTDIRNGLYVVRLLDKNGRQVKSMRLSKK